MKDAGWGFNAQGQLGDGSTDAATQPVGVQRITTATAVAAGGRHTCALLADRTVRCWGEDSRVGNGTLADSTVPVKATQLTNATAIAAGGQHSCAVLGNHTMKCWGHDENGQLGIAYPYLAGEDRWWATPQPVRDLDTATSVTAGSIHTCARLQGGAMKCWGNNTFGQLGTGSFDGNVDHPVPVSRIDDASSVAAGAMFTCAVRAGGKASCWGANLTGQLGIGNVENQAEPAPVLGFGP